MKKPLRLFCLLILLSSCTNEDESKDNEPSISISDLTVRIDENPSANLDLGTLQATTNLRTLNFSILEQNPDGAVQINTSSGQLIVGNSELFDFEINPTITIKVKASNGEVFEIATVTVLLNDIDEIIVDTKDLTVSVDENPTGDSIIGTVEGTTNIGNVIFSVLEQTPEGAITINSETGEVKVENVGIFDFETNPIISTKIKVENGHVFNISNLTINLNDINELTLQERLDNGEWPISIYEENPAYLNDLYGLLFQGGLIFYLDTESGNTLIAAPTDQSDGAEWGCEGTNISEADFSAMEAGFTNTQAIVSTCETIGIAAEICSSYSFAGSDQWYLPSKDELNLMYLNLKANGLGNFSNDWYWTSTEFEDQTSFENNGYEAAWIQSFEDGLQVTYDVGIKRFENSVRAIRLLVF